MKRRLFPFFFLLALGTLRAEVVWHVVSSPAPDVRGSSGTASSLPEARRVKSGALLADEEKALPSSPVRLIVPSYASIDASKALSPSPPKAPGSMPSPVVGGDDGRAAGGHPPRGGEPWPLWPFAVALPLVVFLLWRLRERGRFMADMERMEEELVFREERERI